MKRPSRLPLRALFAAALALAPACTPRDPSLGDFDAKTCGTVSDPRQPIEPVSAAPDALSGTALRLPDGSIRILLNPVVTASGDVSASLTTNDLVVTLSSGAMASFDVKVVTDVESVPSDVVFVIDTTGSMFWAIDGVKVGVQAFVDTLAALHIDAKVGGIEFGDEIRTSSDLADVETFKTWVKKLGVIGGGDAPESPLDALLRAHETMSFRPGAQRYFIVITDTGMHERGDGSSCSDETLAHVASVMRGTALFGVVDAAGSAPPGVAPGEITRALGGLHVGIDVAQALVSFNVSTDTPLDDALAATHVITIPSSAETSSATEVTVRHGTATVSLPIE